MNADHISSLASNTNSSESRSYPTNVAFSGVDQASNLLFTRLKTTIQYLMPEFATFMSRVEPYEQKKPYGCFV